MKHLVVPWLVLSLCACSQPMRMHSGYRLPMQVGYVDLMLFGGPHHSVFLGTLTGTKYDADSVWNDYGDYGSKYTALSIWNAYGEYGSSYSDFSPWNRNASNPPVVVDHAGNFHGTFTANSHDPDRTTIPELVLILEVGQQR